MSIPQSEIVLCPFPTEGGLLRLVASPKGGYDLRVYWLGVDGVWRPGKVGLTFRNKKAMGKVAAALAALVQERKP